MSICLTPFHRFAQEGHAFSIDGRRIRFPSARRAVFRLGENTIELIEVAQGIDVETQVLALMDFQPLIDNVRPMPARAFQS